MTSARWDEGKFDTYLPPDLRTDEEIEQDAADAREEAAYRVRHAVRIAKEEEAAAERYAAHVARVLNQRK